LDSKKLELYKEETATDYKNKIDVFNAYDKFFSLTTNVSWEKFSLSLQKLLNRFLDDIGNSNFALLLNVQTEEIGRKLLDIPSPDFEESLNQYWLSVYTHQILARQPKMFASLETVLKDKKMKHILIVLSHRTTQTY
jgi:hypothetical protein